MYLLKEYPKAIATLIAGVLIVYSSKYLPAELIPLIDKPTLELILTGVVAMIFGKFTRLTKDESELLKEINSKETRNQVTND